VVLAASAATALAMTLAGNGNSAASAGQLSPAPALHAASTQPSPPPSPSPSPSTSAAPPAPAVAPVRLAASLSVSRRGSSGHPETVGFQVINTGSAASGPLTAVIALPAGSSLFSGSGGNEEGAGSLDGTALPSAWSCQQTSGGATCTHAALAAGQQTGGTLLIALSGSAACGQSVSLTITSGGATVSASDAIPC
jgi:hypothetical protein